MCELEQRQMVVGRVVRARTTIKRLKEEGQVEK